MSHKAVKRLDAQRHSDELLVSQTVQTCGTVQYCTLNTDRGTLNGIFHVGLGTGGPA